MTTVACPVCNGEGRVFRMTPEYEAMANIANGDSFAWIGTTHEWRSCKPCGGTGLLPAALPAAGEVHAPGTCVPADPERLKRALHVVDDEVQFMRREASKHRDVIAKRILAALAKQEADHE